MMIFWAIVFRLCILGFFGLLVHQMHENDRRYKKIVNNYKKQIDMYEVRLSEYETFDK